MTARPVFVPSYLRCHLRLFSENYKCTLCGDDFVHFMPGRGECHLCPDCDSQLSKFVQENRRPRK